MVEKFKKNLIYQLIKKTQLEDVLKGYDCSFIAKERLKHIVSKEAFNIDGLGKKVIDQFWKLRLIKKPSDIFDLDFSKIKKLEGWGNLSVNNLKSAIEKSKKISLNKFIYFNWYKTYRARKCKNFI